jgi:hypothetical protein
MTPKPEVITALSATAYTASGKRVVLRKGDTLPSEVPAREAERLRGLGVFGPPKSTKIDDRDEAQVLQDELTAQFNAEDAARGNAPEPVAETVPEPEEDEVGLIAYLQTASVEEVLSRVEEDPEIGDTLLGLARETEGKASLVAALEVQMGISEPADVPTDDDASEREPVDYSGWKGPELNAELKERGIEFKPVGEKNSAKAEKLAADDAAQVG